jgi:hypothetical protein
MKRLAALVLLAMLSCRGILGIGDPSPLGPNESLDGATPIVTDDAAACGFADLVNDAHNCGKCGHDCKGSTCERALCKPVLMTSSDSEVFAVNDDRVYALDRGQLYRVEANGTRLSLATGIAAPHAMHASAQHVLWSDDNGVHLCSITGCAADGPVQLSALGKKVGPIAELPDNAVLYPYIWANYSDSTVEKATATPGTATVLSTNTQLMSAACAPAFAEARSSAYAYDTAAKHFWLYAAEDAGGRNAGPEPDHCALTASDDFVFYTDATSVQRAAIQPDKSLALGSVFATGQSAPKVVTANNTFVYWAASTPQTDIVRCPVASTATCTTPAVVVGAITTITALIVEGDFVYFATQVNDATRIYKVAQ